MVGAADRTVSPSSSRTSRSTPCVLGCWGPMLTVIVSVRNSGIVVFSARSGGQFALDQVADDGQEGHVPLLPARRLPRRHVDMDVGGAACGPAVTSGQRDRRQL